MSKMSAAPDTKPKDSEKKTTDAKPRSFTVSESDILNPEDVIFPDAPVPARDDDESASIDDVYIDEYSGYLDREINIKERREDARGQLAIVFTVATFLLFVLGFILAATTDGDKVENFKEIFITISGIFSGLLGFVIGYYFRRENES